jgi:o-succinylbenzoate---CoA ligase
VTGQLVPVQVPPAEMAAALDEVWAAGDAALPLAVEASDAELARLDATLGPGRRPVPDGTAVVVTTSGSTGEPKGVLLPHAALHASTAASNARLGCVPGDRWLLALPVHHVAGLQVLARARALGTAPVVPAGTGVEALAAAEADHVSLVPTQLGRLLDAGVDLARFRTVLLGGARPDPTLLGRAVLAGARVVVSYGMTETCGGCVYDGVPLDGVEVEVDDASHGGGRGGPAGGRIRLRGPVLCAGYRTAEGDHPATDEDGWFTTGDLGRWVDGRLDVLGRADDVLISGGENVPAAAVAARLREHPAVADVAVTGRADPEWGEEVVAVVVPVDPRTPPELEELRAHVRATHPPAYAPRRLVIVAALPRDELGKVPRAAVRDLVARDTAGPPPTSSR